MYRFDSPQAERQRARVREAWERMTEEQKEAKRAAERERYRQCRDARLLKQRARWDCMSEEQKERKRSADRARHARRIEERDADDDQRPDDEARIGARLDELRACNRAYMDLRHDNPHDPRLRAIDAKREQIRKSLELDGCVTLDAGIARAS
jgi:hypothetical protein